MLTVPAEREITAINTRISAGGVTKYITLNYDTFLTQIN